MRALVTKSTGSWYILRTESGELLVGRLAGKIRLEGRKSTNPVVVGDWVNYNLESDKDVAVIQTIEPRKNYIIRKSLNLSRQTHIIAANIDQALLIATLAFPRTSTGFIDRFLVTCEAYRIPAIIIFNKQDLFSDELLITQQQLMTVYEKAGYKCLSVSALDDADISTVQLLLKNKTTLFSGHSGVGKSTLMNAIEPNLKLKTGEISEAHAKGKHTTTFSELFELDPTTFMIDTPGIKELGLVEMKKEEVGHYFPEIRDRMIYCKFNNCIHVNEPKCAVMEAVQRGEINEERYISYLKILNGEEMDWNEWEVG